MDVKELAKAIWPLMRGSNGGLTSESSSFLSESKRGAIFDDLSTYGKLHTNGLTVAEAKQAIADLIAFATNNTKLKEAAKKLQTAYLSQTGGRRRKHRRATKKRRATKRRSRRH
jgi:hypothetical protein